MSGKKGRVALLVRQATRPFKFRPVMNPGGSKSAAPDPSLFGPRFRCLKNNRPSLGASSASAASTASTSSAGKLGLSLPVDDHGHDGDQVHSQADVNFVLAQGADRLGIQLPAVHFRPGFSLIASAIIAGVMEP